MRQLIVVLLSLALALSSCANHPQHSHAGQHEHSEAHAHHEASEHHEGHEHSEAHDHIGHSHEAHASHKHIETHEHSEACTHNHEAHEHHEHSEAHEHSHEASAHHEGHGSEITISPEDAARAGIQSAIVEKVSFQQAIRCSGVLTPGAQGESVIAASNSGILTWAGAIPSLGQPVSKGEVIASISAPASSKQSSSAQIAYEAAKKQYERAAKLLEDKIISQKEYLELERSYLDARISYSGMSVTAPISGSITAIYAQEGSYLEQGASIARLSTLKTIRLEVQLNERYYPQSSLITEANFTLPYSSYTLNTRELRGKKISSAKQIDSGYISIIFEFPNEQQLLPGSFAQVWLLTQAQASIALSESALIEEQGEYFVYLQLDDECYRKQAVKTGGRNGRQVEIIQGLSEGDRVVTQGAYQVKLASGTIIPGHSHNH